MYVAEKIASIRLQSSSNRATFFPSYSSEAVLFIRSLFYSMPINPRNGLRHYYAGHRSNGLPVRLGNYKATIKFVY